MAVHHQAASFDELIKLTSSLSNPIFILFTGAKDASGKSWCPDCVTAEPVLEATVKSDAPAGCHFITVPLERPFWKDPQCVYRTDSRLRLSSIPALVHWPHSDRKLQEEQCGNADLIKMLFEDAANDP